MATLQQMIQDKLNICATIVRKYNLGKNKLLNFDLEDEEYFNRRFIKIDKRLLQNAWSHAQMEIQNNEIIKDAKYLDSNETAEVNKRINSLDNSNDKLLYFLKSSFDVKSLRLSNENIERRTRRIIADRYLDLEVKEITGLSAQNINTRKAKTVNFLGKLKTTGICIGIVTIFFIPRIIEGLTPLNVLTEKIHEKSKYKFNGSVCNDGHISRSQGRGTCSWHGGVDYKFTKDDYSKTLEECRVEAIKLSWRD